MEKFNYRDVPGNFAHCCAEDCKMAEQCLRAAAWRCIGNERATARVVNPNLINKDGECKYFRTADKVDYAKGFCKMQKRMYPEQYEEFSSILISHFGRNAYFVRRRGEMTMPPSEQEIVREALKKCGADAAMEFDEYLPAYDFRG